VSVSGLGRRLIIFFNLSSMGLHRRWCAPAAPRAASARRCAAVQLSHAGGPGAGILTTGRCPLVNKPPLRAEYWRRFPLGRSGPSDWACLTTGLHGVPWVITIYYMQYNMLVTYPIAWYVACCITWHYIDHYNILHACYIRLAAIPHQTTNTKAPAFI
jgi:hypothetical protein